MEDCGHQMYFLSTTVPGTWYVDRRKKYRITSINIRDTFRPAEKKSRQPQKRERVPTKNANERARVCKALPANHACRQGTSPACRQEQAMPAGQGKSFLQTGGEPSACRQRGASPAGGVHTYVPVTPSSHSASRNETEAAPSRTKQARAPYRAYTQRTSAAWHI